MGIYEHLVNHTVNKYKTILLLSLHVIEMFLHIYFGKYDPQFSTILLPALYLIEEFRFLKMQRLKPSQCSNLKMSMASSKRKIITDRRWLPWQFGFGLLLSLWTVEHWRNQRRNTARIVETRGTVIDCWWYENERGATAYDCLSKNNYCLEFYNLFLYFYNFLYFIL